MKTGKTEDILDWLKPGQRIYVQGGPGESGAFIDLVKGHPERFAGVELWSCLIPGINRFDYGALPRGPSVVTFMASPALEPSIASGRTRIDAMPYSEIGVTLAPMQFDLAILHCAPPDENGLCSFGISAEAPPLVWPRATRRIVFLNRRMPNTPGDTMPAADIDLAIEIDELLASPAPPGPRSAELQAIVRHAAALIPDNATIQSGIGEAPGAIVAALKDRRGLRVHSGLITPEYRLLAEAGAIDLSKRHITGIAWGDAEFYGWLADGAFTFRSALETHGAAHLAAIPDFVSIGSALEVDLAGNINLEWMEGRRVSSVGGAPDFMRGAAASPGGRSIIAFPSTTKAGRSRIVAQLERPSIPASLADTVVTEHGAVRLRGLSAEAKADALIALAAPVHRTSLAATRHT